MGFNFNKLGDMFLQIGKSTLQTGTFYATAKALNSSAGMGPSVFGCGTFNTGCCCSGGYGFTGMGGYNMGMYSQMGMMMNPSTQMALGQAYGQGWALADYIKANSNNNLTGGMMSMMGMGTTGLLGQQQTLQLQTQKLDPTNNAAAEKFSGESTAIGEMYEEKSQKQEDVRFVSKKWKDVEEGENKEQQYKQHVVDLAKSYITTIDKKSGNEDNEITKEEFLKYNLESEKTATGQNSAKMKLAAEAAFDKIDQNGDGKIDWKEMSAVFGTYDAIKDGKRDGIITAEEQNQASMLLADSTKTDIDQKFRTEYTRLFGKNTDEE